MRPDVPRLRASQIDENLALGLAKQAIRTPPLSAYIGEDVLSRETRAACNRIARERQFRRVLSRITAKRIGRPVMSKSRDRMIALEVGSVPGYGIQLAALHGAIGSDGVISLAWTPWANIGVHGLQRAAERMGCADIDAMLEIPKSVSGWLYALAQLEDRYLGAHFSLPLPDGGLMHGVLVSSGRRLAPVVTTVLSANLLTFNQMDLRDELIERLGSSPRFPVVNAAKIEATPIVHALTRQDDDGHWSTYPVEDGCDYDLPPGRCWDWTEPPVDRRPVSIEHRVDSTEARLAEHLKTLKTN